jgi:hypothetical protein
MGWFGMLVLGLSAAAQAPQEAVPTASPQGHEVVTEKLGAQALREKYQKPPRCAPVPPELFHPAPQAMRELVPEDASLAGAGPWLAVSFRHPKEPVFVLRLFRKGRLAQELFLTPQGGVSLPGIPELAISNDGQYAALFSRTHLAIFAGGTQVGMLQTGQMATSVAFRRDEVLWCRRELPPRLNPTLLAQGEYAVCFWSEPGRGSEEVLFALEPEDVELLGGDARGMNFSFAVAPRRDGKLWFVNRMTGEVILANASGSRLRRWVLPHKVTTDPEVLEAKAKAKAQEVAATLEAAPRDATEPPRPRTAKVAFAVLLVWQVQALGNDLVFVTHPDTLPPNAVFWLSADLQTLRCFDLQQLGDKPTSSDVLARKKTVVVTEDALWLQKPLGFLRWEELLAWQEKQKAKTPPAEKPTPPAPPQP